MARGGTLAALLLGAAVYAAAAPIPADLEARADTLRRSASPAVLSFARSEAAALAKASGPVDVSGLERRIRAVLGDLNGADIEAVAFLVLMEAAKSAQEDLKAIMAHVKAINNAKAQERQALSPAQKSAVARPTATPTPAPDRVDVLVAAARNVSARRMSSDLSRVARR